MKKNGFILLVILLATTFLMGQNSRQEIYYQKKFSEASTCFIGKVISKESYKGYLNNRIYTRNLIEITKSLKGNFVDADIVELTTQGGELDNTIEIVGHGENIPINEEFLFMCSEFKVKELGWESHLMLHGENSYTSVASNRKLLKYLEEFSVLSGERAMTNTIEFEFDNVAINGNRLKFDILAKTNLADAKFASADLFIEYSENVFGNNIVSNEGININRASITQNNLYELSLVDESINTAKLSIISDCINGKGFADLSSEFQSLVRVDVTISNLSEIGEISLDAFAIEGNVYYWQNCATIDNSRNCCFSFDKIEVPTPISTRTPCTIIRADTLLTAGTGDILTIIGTGFDTLQSTVKFPNADDGGMTLMSAQPLDIFEWNDSTIQVRVPSLETAADPAGSGNFFVFNVSGDSCISPRPLEIRYAVNNFRRNDGLAQWIYMGDVFENSNYKFHVDSTIANNADAFSTVNSAICDWNMATGVDWEVAGVSNLNTMGNDSINLIYLADSTEFAGSCLGATATSIRTVQFCFGSPGLEPDTVFAFNADLDIKIREDVTQIGSAEWHFNKTPNPGSAANLFDFYSVIIHELGHNHDLSHALDSSKLMFWKLLSGQSKRIITQDDKDGGNHALNESGTSLPMLIQCVTPIGRNSTLCINPVGQIEESFDLKVYPNPIYLNQLNIDFTLDQHFDNVDIKLFDLSGKEMISIEKGEYDSGRHNTRLNINKNIPSGMYFLNIIIGSNSLVYKVQKIQ